MSDSNDQAGSGKTDAPRCLTFREVIECAQEIGFAHGVLIGAKYNLKEGLPPHCREALTEAEKALDRAFQIMMSAYAQTPFAEGQP